VSIRFGDCAVDTEARELRRAGRAVALSPKAYQLLELLLEQRPKAVSKRQIFDRLWPSTFVSEANLSALIFEIRAALGDDARKPEYIRTVRGFGYSFSGAACADRSAETRTGASCRLILEDREVVLAEGENVLGRTHDAVVWIESPRVSRRHARILVSGQTATLEDLGSKNGTRLRGHKIAGAQTLHDGDEIRVGPLRMLFRIFSPEAPTATDREDEPSL
jgi:DNA-binding winged helix-turn-helix (wHTH) protein